MNEQVMAVFKLVGQLVAAVGASLMLLGLAIDVPLIQGFLDSWQEKVLALLAIWQGFLPSIPELAAKVRGKVA